MAGKDGREDEIDALSDIEGIDTAKLAAQIADKGGIKSPPKEDPPKGDPPKADPPKSDPPKSDPPKQDVPDPEKIRAGILNEMFGDQFKDVEEVKKANIPNILKEVPTLRQRVQDLETQLKAKPKHNFANDDIAKFNEFVRETGIKDASVFNKLSAIDVANMNPMDALVQQHIIENPTLAGKEPQVRAYLEKKYNVDPSKVETGDLTQEELEINLIGVTADGEIAKRKISDLKSKIKMPEVPADDDSGKRTKWTPETETQQKAGWTTLGQRMLEEWKTIPITRKGSKEPIVNFVVPEEAKKALLKNAIDYVVSNQMEVNETNVKVVAQSMYQDLRLSLQEDIIDAVFDRAKGMTDKEYLEKYHNPSKRNTDQPDGGGEEDSEEAKRDKAFKAELDR